MNEKESNRNGDIALVFRKKSIPPPSVLLLTLPKEDFSINDDDQHRRSPTAQLRCQQRRKHPISFHLRDSMSQSATHWQRYSDKMSQVMPAPDVAYRNTYLEKKTMGEHSRSSSIRLSSVQQDKSSTEFSSPRSTRETIYDHLRQSLRQIDQQRNRKQQNISVRIQRPQNEDQTFRRVLAEKKHSARSTTSRSSLTTTKSKLSSVNEEFNTTQSFVNYINYSRLFQT